MSGVFQALVVIGLFLLIAVVGLATVVMARRGRHNAAAYESGSARSTESMLGSGSGSALVPGVHNEAAEGDSSAEEPASLRRRRSRSSRKGSELLASAQSARAEADEESRARRLN